MERFLKPSLLVLSVGGALARSSEMLSVEDFVKIRCAIDGSDTFYTWEGSIYSYQTQEKQLHMLDFIGYNVARCEKIDGEWMLITRELSYYLDPKTKAKLSIWFNPITHEDVNVMHVANDPVNNAMGPTASSVLTDTTAVINSDINLFYDNPLHSNESYADYGGYLPKYQGGEYFKFYYDMEDLKTAENAVEDVAISWTRAGQWLPWMHMGQTLGGIYYSCSGGRAKDLSHMPQWLQEDVKTRLPLYLHAPYSYDPEEPNDTSSTVFMESFDEYLAGEQFPLPAPDEMKKH